MNADTYPFSGEHFDRLASNDANFQLDTPSFDSDSRLGRALSVAFEPAARARDHLLQVHTYAGRLRDEYPERSSIVETSIQKFSESIRSLDSNTLPGADIDHFEHSRHRVLEDNDLLLAEIRSLGAAENRIATAEYQVASEQANFISRLQIIIKQLSHKSELKDALVDVERARDSWSSKAEIPSVLEKYYEAIADANIQWERLAELDLNHWRNLKVLDRSESQEQDESAPTKEIEQEYESQRRMLEGNIQEAKIKVAAARQACIVEDIDPDEASDANPSESSISLINLEDALAVEASHETRKDSCVENSQGERLRLSISEPKDDLDLVEMEPTTAGHGVQVWLDTLAPEQDARNDGRRTKGQSNASSRKDGQPRAEPIWADTVWEFWHEEENSKN